MEIRLLLFFCFLSGIEANAQLLQVQADVNCLTPTPPGYNIVYALDIDNDGLTLFDMQYYLDYVDRPQMESYFGVSSSGYEATFYANGGVQPFLYTNVTPNEFCAFVFEYNGSGPEFSPQPPCYRPIIDYFASRGLRLDAIPHNGDDDNDGILNADEDTNNNLNLMDDDDDNDGIINLKDATNNLASVQHTAVTLNVYPNPVTDGVINFDSNVVIASVTVYDITGKQVYESKINGTTLNVNTLKPGIYFLKFDTGNGHTYKKIAVR